MTINTFELKTLRIALLYAKKLERDQWRPHLWRWDNHEMGDRPVTLSKTHLSLINKGLLERIIIGNFEYLRATKIASEFRCRNTGCCGGDLYVSSGNFADTYAGKCPNCKGFGVVTSISDAKVRQGGE